MSDVYSEFDQTLRDLRRKYKDRPREEIMCLWFLALEREKLVSVAYDERLIGPRLAKMPIPDEVREIIRHALIWIWKEEEMHAVYVRGALLKVTRWPVRIRALGQLLSGFIAGWTSSVQQHVRWQEAPLSRAFAGLFTGLGFFFGKIPKGVRKELSFRPFRDFCLFNVEAEKTAALCWDRLVDLCRSADGFSPNDLAEFQRMKNDEDRHGDLFAIFAEALTSQDELASGVTAQALVEKVRAVGQFFLPLEHRRQSVVDSPLGQGGPVRIVHGRSAEEKVAVFCQLLDQSELSQQLAARARAVGKSVNRLRVAIKPTFMLGYHRRDLSPITDPELLIALASYLRESGCAEVTVVEGRNIYDRFYRHRSVKKVAEYFHITSPLFTVVDSSEDQLPHSYDRGTSQYSISRTWKEADFRISFAKLRSHPVDQFHLSVANIEGVGARFDEFLFAERQADRESSIMMILSEFPPHFAIIEGYENAPDGIVGCMGSPNPKAPRRFYAGSDALAVDMVAARHLGVVEPRKSRTLHAACHWFGDPTPRIERIGADELIQDWKGPYHNEFSALLSLVAYPIYVIASGRGALFVPEMDEEAFPLKSKERWALRLARRGLQRFLGLHHPKGRSRNQTSGGNSR